LLENSYQYNPDHLSKERENMFRFIELVGSSPTSWEDAAKNAIDTACDSLWNVRIAEVKELDVALDDKGKIATYRVKIMVSFKYDNWKMELGWKVPKGDSVSEE
jgi:dodecin